MDTTLDGLLDRRVALEQPAQGYRVAVDTVLLAAAVPVRAGETALDLGCGAGGAMLSLACRVPGISITGIEIQPELAELCRRNIARNAFPAEMKIVEGDVTKIFGEEERYSSPPLEGGVRGGGPPLFPTLGLLNAPPPNPSLEGGGIPPSLAVFFDHVFMNPPYHEETRHDLSPDAIKRIANTEKEGDLLRWIKSAAEALKCGGMLALIHRADRLDQILAHMAGFFGGTDVLPILPKTGLPPRRVIIRATKGGQPSVRQYKSFVLHNSGGGYTDEAESILRHVKAMDFIEKMT